MAVKVIGQGQTPRKCNNF